MAEQVEFYQIFYKDEQKNDLYDFAIPYYNEGLTPFFENSIISKLVKQTKAEKIGIASHSLRHKRHRLLPELTKELLETQCDVLALTRSGRDHEMLKIAEHWHGGFTRILKMIGEKIGQAIPNKITNPIYQNHFIAKTSIYRKYVNEFLDPAMQAMSEDVELMGLCWQNARYDKDIFGKPTPKDRLKEFLKIDYYPMHPFLCERFFSCWIEGKKLNIKYV